MDYTFTYRLGRDDYVALLRANRAMCRLGRWGRAALIALLCVAFIWTFSSDSLLDHPWRNLLIYGIAFAILMLIVPRFERVGDLLMARVLVSRYRVANKELTLELGDDGIHSTFDGIEGRIPWSAIVRLFTTNDHLFLGISRAEMLVIPRRATASAEAFAELTRYVHAKVPAA
jgi:YcxB-like protein